MARPRRGSADPAVAPAIIRLPTYEAPRKGVRRSRRCVSYYWPTCTLRASQWGPPTPLLRRLLLPYLCAKSFRRGPPTPSLRQLLLAYLHTESSRRGSKRGPFHPPATRRPSGWVPADPQGGLCSPPKGGQPEPQKTDGPTYSPNNFQIDPKKPSKNHQKIITKCKVDT